MYLMTLLAFKLSEPHLRPLVAPYFDTLSPYFEN